jgi:uncharacterized membrane protein YozB (DUF420 family)
LTVSSLPAVNATLNAIATVLLILGYVFIRRGRIDAHRRSMIAAFATSVLFLLCYLVYHYHAGSRPFPGQGPIRIVYFTILISHIILAALVPALAVVTIWLGLKDRRLRHRRIARWTLPIWLYVSITGIIVYWMLYQVY